MKKLQPVFDLINWIVVQSLEVRLGSASDEAVTVGARLQSVLLRTDEAEGLALQEIQASVERLQLPHPGDPNLYATLRLDRLDLDIAPSFWERASKLAKNPQVKKLGILLDRVEVRNARVEVALSPARIADIVVTLESCRVKLLGQLVQETLDLRLEVLDLDLAEKNRKKALSEATVRLGDLKIRLLEVMLNRLIEIGRDKFPAKAKLNNLEIALVDNLLRITIKTGYLPMAIPVELKLSTRDNQLGIYIVKIFISMARGLILSAVNHVTANKPEVKVQGDNLWINPWVKAPFPVDARFERFVVEDGAVLLQFASLPQRTLELPEPQTEPALQVVDDRGQLPPPLPV